MSVQRPSIDWTGLPLEGCIERLKRADHHLESFQTAIATPEVRSHVAKLPIKAKLNLERNKLEITATKDVRLPVSLGILFGDVIHNLHATLDNLVYELARLNVDRPEGTVQFPILDQPNEWLTENTQRMLAGVAPRDRAHIEAHQPFMALNGVPAKHNVLARLRRYSNEGKHRVVTPLGGVSMGSVVEDLKPTDVRIIGSQLDVQKALRKNAVLASFDIEITGDNPSVEVQGGFTWYPALDDGDPAEQFLKRSVAYVYTIVKEFLSSSFGFP